MRVSSIGLICAAAALSPALATAEQPIYLFSSSRTDCIVHTIFDRTTGEDVTRATRCTLPYIKGVNLATGAKWNADIYSGGELKGVDIDGNHFHYDPRTKLWSNLTTGRKCSMATPRHVCTG